MKKSDAAYMRDMVENIDVLQTIAARTSREQFCDDPAVFFGVQKLLQNIGEAASKISPASKSRFPSIPWKDIIVVRHKIVHEYDNIDEDLLWSIAAADAPALRWPLITALKRLESEEGA